ncbi:uncharacterized protein C1orf127 homolog [Elephas maximus indicus]|uniref:uncharacterized protein C1orf127 homolog n=1 Tax=Elephas maximus indicus TaxID=99487 RepID=UPI00211626E2|nr:uncharacterized protein C1orf127 homolog [Elephas maximus indicus]
MRRPRKTSTGSDLRVWIGVHSLNCQRPPDCEVPKAQSIARAWWPRLTSVSDCAAPRDRRRCFGAECHPTPCPNEAPARSRSGRRRQARPHGSLLCGARSCCVSLDRPNGGAHPAKKSSVKSVRDSPARPLLLMERVKAEQAAQHILPHPSLLSCRALCLACALSAEFTWTLPFKSNRDTPSPALEISTDKVECFSDYMALWIPKSQVKGLRQWLSRTLHLPGTWRTPRHLDPFLAKCGYFLHPDPHGDFIFRALYSASLVQKEKANYRLEIRIFQKGVRRLEQSDGYVMKCPMTTPRLGQVHVHCGSTFVQVSRPLPLENSSAQPPWLLSLRGELAASLEDASLIGLYVDINATSITIQSPRPELLQRWEVLNTSTELLPLWLVSGYSAYSLEATCPLVSSQPELEVLVHIPKQRLGLVKRGFHFEETLSLRFLRVHQSSTFTVTESQDFVVVSIPAAGVLRVQQCQDGQEAPGTQAFYRVDLSLEFAEMATPVLWTVENFFQCVGSGTELPASAAMLRTAPSPQSPGPETPPAASMAAAGSMFALANPVTPSEPQ